ncbi:MAG: precorrin-6A synthase (deacetylating) [Nocardioides sp.]
MRALRVVGIGPGGADQLTVEAARALESVDVFLVADKGEAARDLQALREEVLRRHTTGRQRVVAVPDPERDREPTSYGAAVADWHEARALAYEEVLRGVGQDETAGFLVWGDPSLYDSTLRVVERILERGELSFPYDVVPGVSSVSLLAARHRIVLHRVGEPVTVTTGRRLAQEVAAGRDNLVVMLDGHLACADLDGDWDLWWGANLGTADEVLVAGRLAEVVDDVRELREGARDRRGWVMDTYLLRRTGG